MSEQPKRPWKVERRHDWKTWHSCGGFKSRENAERYIDRECRHRPWDRERFRIVTPASMLDETT